MLLSEIRDQILLETGQYIVGDISNLFINMNQLWVIAKKALGIYDKYKPISKKFTIMTSNNRYIFPDDIAPEFVSSAYPTGYGYVNPFTITDFSSSGGEYPQVVFRYVKPNLITSLSGQFEVSAHYKRSYTITYTDNTNTTIQDVDIPEITETDVFFFDLIQGLFLQTVGKFRRAFNLADSDIVMDVDALVAEGKEKYEEALLNIQDTSKWYLGLGG